MKKYSSESKEVMCANFNKVKHLLTRSIIFEDFDDNLNKFALIKALSEHDVLGETFNFFHLKPSEY